jgi:ribA/ribD-fused uncharacterized protein
MAELPLTREGLIAAMSAGFAPDWCFFWGHTPAKDGGITKSCFSQWWVGHPFVVGGDRYATAEHWMMAEKARAFGDEEVRARVLAATHPRDAKGLGRTVRGFDETRWAAMRWDIVVRGNAAKFGQNSSLADALLNTGDSVVVEASPTDQIWGIGMAADDPGAEQPAQWPGLNLLGFALMAVRAQLRAS